MKAVRLVSTVHALWGMTLMTQNIPRPFGALEPYFLIAPPFYAGIMLALAGGAPLLAIRAKWFRCLLCAVVPQQVLLCWALGISMIDVVRDGDVRTLLALCYWVPMTYYHFREGVDLAVVYFYKARADGKLDG